MFRKNNNGYLIAILIAVLMLCLITVYASSSVSKEIGVSAKAATLYQPDMKKFIISKNANKRMHMASTTKIMTALVALESTDDLEERVKIDEKAIGVEGSSAYLKSGDVLSMRELLYALLLQSANDAAVAIACHIGGGVDGFADMMNRKAVELGLEDTHFTNPHGLDDEEHYTTAHDLALIACAAMENEELAAIASTYKKTITTGERRRTYVNHNKLLQRYDGAIGVKTGFTDESGRCLVGAAERDGVRLISVTLDAPDDWNDHKEMLDLGFDSVQKITLASTYEYSFDLPLINGDRVRVTNTDELAVIAENADYEITESVVLPRFISRNYNKGDSIGAIKFKINGTDAGQVQLVLTEDVRIENKRSVIDKITEWLF